jgi:hypothetical protein
LTKNKDTLEWKVGEVKNPSECSPRAGHTTHAMEYLLFVLGGVTVGGEYLNEVIIFDTETLNWARPTGIKSLNGIVPSPRAFHATVAMGQHLYMFGGRNTDTVFDDIHIFNASK